MGKNRVYVAGFIVSWSIIQALQDIWFTFAHDLVTFSIHICQKKKKKKWNNEMHTGSHVSTAVSRIWAHFA